MKNERGLSPVIATVLLIAMVVVIGLVIFLWFRSFQQEAVTKFEGTNIELVCKDVEFEANYAGGTLTLSNLGNVPVYQILAKISSDNGRTQESVDVHDISGANWPSTGLAQGRVLSINVGGSDGFTSGDSAKLIPILRGKTSKGEKTYVCDDQYGVPIEL